MDVLFLILNYKTYNETILLTKELLSSTTILKYKILIVDNDSPNESFEIIKDAFKEEIRVEVVSSGENGGYAKGNNFGMRYAKKYSPKYVCIINNDVHFSFRTIESLCVWYEKLPNVAFIAPKQKLPNGEDVIFKMMDVPTLKKDINLYNPFSNKKHYYVENTTIEGVCRIGIIPGAFIFTSYSLFERLGFFDESTFLFCEERFIAKKAEIAGLCNYIILNETYLHNHSTTISSEASEKRQRKMIFDGRCLYHKKYSSHPVLAVLLLKIVFNYNEFVYSIARRINYLIKGKKSQIMV